jgi:hypothetical protein
MPAIPDYFAPNAQTTIRPNETGEQSLIRAGVMGERRAAVSSEMRQRGEETMIQGAERLGKSVVEGGVDLAKIGLQHAELADATSWTKTSSDLQLGAHQQLNDLAKAGDPAAITKWYTDTWQPALAKAQEGATTEEGQKQRIAQGAALDRDMQHQMLSTSSMVSAENTIVNADKTVNTLSQAVGTNLAALPQAHQTLDNLFDSAIKAATTPEEVEHLRTEQQQKHKELDVSALRSAASQPTVNWQALQRAADSGLFKYTDSGQISGFIKEGRRADEMAGRMAQVEARENQRAAQEKNFATLVTQNTDPVTGRMTADFVKNAHAAAVNGQISGEQYFSSIEHAEALTSRADRAEAASKLDPAVLDKLQIGAGLPASDPRSISTTNILDEAITGHITPTQKADLLQLKAAAADDPVLAKSLTRINDDPTIKSQFEGAFERLKGLAGDKVMNTTIGAGINPAVAAKMAQFRADTLTTLQQAAMRHEDLAPYLDPNSKQYVFSQARIDQYQPTKNELATQLVAPALAKGAAAPAAERPSLEDIIRKNLSFPAKPDNRPPPT